MCEYITFNVESVPTEIPHVKNDYKILSKEHMKKIGIEDMSDYSTDTSKPRHS